MFKCEFHKIGFVWLPRKTNENERERERERERLKVGVKFGWVPLAMDEMDF